MKVKVIEKVVPHIYSCYPLYQLIYGRPKAFKAIDLLRLEQALENYVLTEDESFKQRMRSGMSIFESFSGISEHKQLIEHTTALNVNKYYSMDMEDQNLPDVLVGDVTDLNIDFPEVDVVTSFFFSFSTINRDMTKGFESLINYFRNAYEATVNTDGAVYAHVGSTEGWSHLTGLTSESPDLQDTLVLEVPLNALMRQYLNLHETEYYTCEVQQDTTFNIAINSYVKENITATIKDSYGHEVARFKVEQPFVWREWLAHEVLEAARIAGFTGAKMFNVSGSFDTYRFDMIDVEPQLRTSNFDVKPNTDNVPTDILFFHK